MRTRLAVPFLLTAVLAGPAAAEAKVIVGYMERKQPLDVRMVYPVIAKPGPNDPNRCVGFRMGEWTRVKHAVSYDVVFDPPEEVPGAYPVSAHVSDDAPVMQDRPMGKGFMITRGDPPPTSYETSVGTLTWPNTVARAMIGWYSTGQGCDEAVGQLQSTPFTVRTATVRLSIPVRRIVQDDPPPKKGKKAPKGAVMQVVEIDGGRLHRIRDGKKQRLRFGDYLEPGDVIIMSEGGAAAIEMITGGRIGVVGGNSILILSENQVKNLSEGKADKALKSAQRVWSKISEPRAPLEIETAGGVMGIKG